eukprot:scaffold2858_cov659-Pavlova_lutheri.AAC.96
MTRPLQGRLPRLSDARPLLDQHLVSYRPLMRLDGLLRSQRRGRASRTNVPRGRAWEALVAQEWVRLRLLAMELNDNLGLVPLEKAGPSTPCLH